MLGLAGAVLLVCGAAGCATKPPDESIGTPVPFASPTPIPFWTARVDGADLDVERHAREVTLRVRNLGCGSVGVGSAVAIGPRLLATNRHVVEGAQTLEIATWDGRTIVARATEVASDQDLGIVRVDVDLPAFVQTAADAAAGDAVTAVGYPEGRQFERLTGTVVDYVDGSVFEENSRVMRVTIPLEHGNSGGAVLNEQGEMVGIVFALELATGYGLVIPASALERAVDSAAFTPSRGGC